MHLHTKFARLSRQAMTSEHGQLLQDSGFTKQDSRLPSSSSLGRTTIRDLTGLSYLSGPTGTVTGRWSSGRPAMQSIPRTEGRSTSARQFLEIASMYSTEELRAILSSALQKISSLPLRSVPADRLRATPSWEHNLGSTRSAFWLDRERVASYFGSIPMVLDIQRVRVLGDNFDYSALSQYP